MLQGFKEGVFIIEQRYGRVLFRNKAALRLNRLMRRELSSSLVNSKDQFDRRSKLFELFDMSAFKQGNYHLALADESDNTELLSIN